MPRIYTTHRLSAGPLRVAVPAADGTGNSDELVIDDDGADVSDELAAVLIASRDATLDAPEGAQEPTPKTESKSKAKA